MSSTAIDSPTLERHRPTIEKSDSLGSSKLDYVDEKALGPAHDHPIVLEDVGEVFDDVRDIDLDDTGKERPIESDADWALRLISLDDDPTMRIWTLRSIFLGLGLSCFGAVLGELFYFRPQTIYVSQLFLQIISYILGKLIEEFIPGPGETARIKMPDNLFWRFCNHGPFNIKEHVTITIMAATASTSAFAIGIFAAQDLYYNVEPNAAIGIFTLIASQLIGYGLAGVCRIFLVYPTYAKYPMLVPQVQLFDALHRGQNFMLQKKRVKFFWGIFIGIFIWEWFPEYIAPLLNGISIFCLANQNSAWFTRIFGGAAGNEGLGTFALSLDWNYVGSGGGAIGSLFTPLSVQLSLYGGCAICMITFCAVYAMNVFKAQNFPFLSQDLFYENGTEYDQLAILNDDYTLNETKLEAVGLPFYAGSQVIYQASRTMYIGAAVAHFALWHSRDVYHIIRKSRIEECDDPHYQKMKVYKEAPQWWYLTILALTLALAIGLAYASDSGLPWWGVIVAIIFALVFLPIIGTLYATVGYAPSVENLVQMVAGGMFPGKPVSNMYFTLYGYNSVVQGYTLLKDLKMGQYCKIPPRSIFSAQVIGTIIGGVLNYVIMRVVVTTNRDILLDVQGTNVWSGQQVQSYNSGAVAWGALGKPLFAPGTLYGWIPWTILAGLGFPIPFYFLHKRWPKFGWDSVYTPVLVAELGYLSVGINSSVFSSFLLAVFSQYYLRKYRPRWFRKYNFLLSAALDGGTQVMVFVYSFAVGGASGTAIAMPTWALNPSGNPDYCLRLSD